MPGARAVLRRITELGGAASYDDVQQYFADHPTARGGADTRHSHDRIGSRGTRARRAGCDVRQADH
ncbi:hypothetical protein FPZ41_26740 [Streptomyces sp. K1PN6]|uniref:Uncharacterized protein n=1 Tax=Streptomyces acidicola TaxID=2596892 RepID=A0A5N8WZG2_9ACTN|nr:hypothetical protein [Streptomyces acidicola]